MDRDVLRRLRTLAASRGTHVLLAFVAGLVAAVAVAGFTSRTTGTVGVGTVELSLRPGGHARTSLVLPPLGSVTARTHDLPVTVTAEVKALDVERVQELVDAPDPAATARSDAVRGFDRQLRRMALRTVALSAVVGAAACVLLPRRRWRWLPVGALGGVVGAGLLLGSVWRSYDVMAFERSPTFRGELERAPALLETVRRHVEDVDVVRSRVGTLGARIAELYTATAGEDLGSRAGTRVLHVSDVHSNPLGVEVARRLIDSFDVEAVLDTGDLTTFGSPVETRIADLVADLGVRYVLVPGNHDSPENRFVFAQVPHIEVLDGTTTRIDRVSVLGIADPTFTADNEVSTEAANDTKDRLATRVGRTVRRADPDVLAVHDLRQAADAVGHVPVVVAGHSHRRSAKVVDGTLLLTVGSTGATGLGSFTTETDLAYEAQVLHFRGRRLVAIDYISLKGLGGGFTVDHVVLDGDEPTASGHQSAARATSTNVRSSTFAAGLPLTSSTRSRVPVNGNGGR